MDQVAHLRGAPRLDDRSSCLLYGDDQGPIAGHYVYVDNLGVLGWQPYHVSKAMAASSSEFNRLGLETHDDATFEGAGEALGCRLDGERMATTLTASRYWKIRAALAWVLRCRSLLLADAGEVRLTADDRLHCLRVLVVRVAVFRRGQAQLFIQRLDLGL